MNDFDFQEINYVCGMKKIFTLIIILFSLNSFSQSVFIPAVSTAEGFCNSNEIVVYSKFINKFNTPNLKFIRIENNLTPNWTSAFCDCEFCYGATVDSAEFFIGIGDSCTTSAHFYADSTKGQGTVKIKVFPRNDPSNYIIGEFKSLCWEAGITNSYMNAGQLVVSPNPANNNLNVSFGSGENYVLNIMSADGRVIVKENVNGLHHNADISFLNSGLYSVKVESAGKVFYSKFIKL